MGVKWKDTSSFSRDDADRTPRCWSLRLEHLRISVHRHIHHEPDDWLLSTVPTLFDDYVLSSKDADAAKAEALRLVRERLLAVVKELEDEHA